MSTNAPRSSFDDFLARALHNVETRAAYEDSQSRHRVVDALVRLRNRLGMTQTDVAKAMGIKQPAVSGFETEGSDPRLSTLQRYAHAVDATLWVQVVPNATSTRRVDFYFPPEGGYAPKVRHDEVTHRATTWVVRGRPYRHLQSVPDRVPA